MLHFAIKAEQVGLYSFVWFGYRFQSRYLLLSLLAKELISHTFCLADPTDELFSCSALFRIALELLKYTIRNDICFKWAECQIQLCMDDALFICKGTEN